MGHILSVLPQSRQDRRNQIKTKIAGIYCYYEKYRLTETIHTDTCPATQIGHLGLVHTECIVIPCIMDVVTVPCAALFRTVPHDVIQHQIQSFYGERILN